MDDAERWRELYRAQRHETINHLQVVSGWLQLERPDRAQQYIAQVSRTLDEISPLVRQAPAVALRLLEAAHQASQHAVPIVWELEAGLVHGPALDALLAVLGQAFAVCAGEGPLQIRLAAQPPAVTLTLAAGQRWPRPLPGPLAAAIQGAEAAGAEVRLQSGDIPAPGTAT